MSKTPSRLKKLNFSEREREQSRETQDYVDIIKHQEIILVFLNQLFFEVQNVYHATLNFMITELLNYR